MIRLPAIASGSWQKYLISVLQLYFATRYIWPDL